MVSYLQAIILGIVQGLTEFLPVSSSGHLVLFQNFLGVSGHQLFLDVMLHFGTMLAVIIFFWRDIWQLIKVLPLLIRFSEYGSNFKEDSYFHLLCLVIIGTIPTLIIGLTLKDQFEIMFGSPQIVCFTLIITGFLLYSAERVENPRRPLKEITVIESVFIGVMQGAAITPGISRSGSTIAGAMWRRINPEAAGRFSFILSLPAILGAVILEAQDVAGKVSQSEILVVIAGTAAAFITGLAALKLLMFLLKERKLKYFAYYCWALGTGGLITWQLGYF